MKAELCYKDGPENSGLWFYGEYVGDDVRKAILAAGWEENEFKPSMIPADQLEDWMQTDEFNQPAGSGLFGGSTKEEGARNIEALKAALAPLGIKVGKPRKLSMQELI